MRKTLFLYIFKEMLIYFLISFFFFFLIFFINQILFMAEDILSKKAPLKDVLLLMTYSLPSIIATSAPFAALVGTLMGIGRLVSDREILSMKALGFSIHSIFIPIIAVGILISIFSFFTNDILLPAGTIRFNMLYKKILTSTPALELESNTIKRNQNAIVVTGTITNKTMDSLLVIDSGSDGNRRIISASQADIIDAFHPSVLMTLRMHTPIVVTIEKNDRTNFDMINAQTLSYNILLKNVIPSYSSSVHPREMSSRDLFTELKQKKIEGDSRIVNLYSMEFHKKFSIPFGAFFFVTLAFPLGLLATSNGQSVGFIAGLIIAVLYWAMLIGGQTLSLRLNLNGVLMMWLPNAVIGFFGLIFLIKGLFR